jgi:NAD-dependent deacetylase
MDRAHLAVARCDLLIMIGSSLEVQPASLFPAIAHQAGAALLFINRTPTPYDHLATVSFSESAGQVMTELLEK